LSGYTATAGGLLLALGACCGAAAGLQIGATPAVVIVPEAIARSGPFEEAKVLHQFRDGTELTVLDEKEMGAGNAGQLWLQVRDAAGRAGWIRSDNLSVLGATRDREWQ
jgi:SH3-like domain-containing protein